MNEVVAEWGGRRYSARVDGYGGAQIIGGPIGEFENEKEKAMNNQNEQQGNEQPEVLSVTVTEVVEKLLERQTALEAKVAALERFGNLQQLGLEKLSAVVDAHQRLFEAQSGYVAPDAGKASSN